VTPAEAQAQYDRDVAALRRIDAQREIAAAKARTSARILAQLKLQLLEKRP
jgi:hypothetical protein